MPVTSTFDDLIRRALARQSAAKARGAELLTEVKRLHERAKAESRSLTEAEYATAQAAMAAYEPVKVELESAQAELKRWRDAEAEERAVDLKMTQTTPGAGAVPARRAYDQVARVGAERRTYSPDTDQAGTSLFLADVIANHLHRDPIAAERLGRHVEEERVERGQYSKRSVGTGAFAGLTVPQYLTELYAPAVAAMRPFADICTHHPLPDQGMTINISKITTPSAAGLQASQNAAVTEQNMADTLLTENIQTISGQQTVSRQAIDRGAGIEQVIVRDLMNRYATQLDSTLLVQVTTGLAPISTSQTYTNATVDTTAIPAFMKQIPQAQSTIEAAMLAMGVPTHAIMHSRRFNWLTAAVSANWPVMSGVVPPQSWGITLSNDYRSPIRGRFANGLEIVVDGNVSTQCLAQATTGGTQDQVYLVCADEMHLWEDPNAPLLIRAEQPAAANLGVVLVAYGYMAYSFRRYGSAASVVINGSGLATPSFA
jgi:hypothetical protein